MKTVIVYKRVSTARQGVSGLGLEAQEAAIKAFLATVTAVPSVLAEYVEVESGKRSDRAQLKLAMDHARLTGSTLVIGKLDRLSRDAHFLLGLAKSGIEFICADMPSANRLTVGIMAMVAEEEGRMISARTKAALAAAKARGVVLGNPHGAIYMQGLGNRPAVAAIKRKAFQRACSVMPVIETIRMNGTVSANGIAEALNDRSIRTARGGRWHAKTVLEVIRRVSN